MSTASRLFFYGRTKEERGERERGGGGGEERKYERREEASRTERRGEEKTELNELGTLKTGRPRAERMILNW